MKTNSPIARAVMACTAVAMTMAAVSPALAQSGPAAPAYEGQAYDSQGQYYYDGCRRDTNNRAVSGGLIGLAAGAIAGSNLAGRHNRDEGTVLGGVVGALVGSQVGKSTAACQPAYEPAPRAYVTRPAYRYESYYAGPVYAQPAPPPPPPPPPAPSYYDYAPAATDMGCQNVESRIRMPDGKTQTRLVKTCPDRNGNYQIVD